MEQEPTDLAPGVARWLPPGARLLIATSGGPDSQALLSLLAGLRGELGLELFAAGVDHRLRAEAAAELDLAAALAESLGVPFVRLRVEVATAGNLLANARQARYGALREHAAAMGATHLALAHTATDQAETLLMNLTRGSGLRGAGAMAPLADDLVRPLLDVSRAQILAYLDEQGIPFARDPSNDDLQRSRSRVRHQVLPALRAINPEVERSLTRFARLAREEEATLAHWAEETLAGAAAEHGGLRLAPLVDLPMPLRRRVVAAWLDHQALPTTSQQLERIGGGIDAGELAISLAGRQLRLDAGCLWLEPAEAVTDFVLDLSQPGETTWPGLGARLRCRRASAAPGDAERAKNAARSVAFDADRLHFELEARPWRRGDRLRPYGLDGHVNVGDLFTNAKIPPLARPRWPLVVHGDDVVWVVGLRRGDQAPVTRETRQIIWIDLLGDLPGLAC